MINFLKDFAKKEINLNINLEDDKFDIVSNLYVDLHSHTLPYIDDGSESMEESIEMVKEFINLGYKKIILTPHIMGGYYNNSVDNISVIFEELLNEICKQKLKIEVEVSAEYYLDDNFYELLKDNQLMPIHENYILFETSLVNLPLNLDEIIFEMKVRGYTPIFAHPERYRYIDKDNEIYIKLKDLGILFQLEINTFNGKYGEEALKKAMWLSKMGWIDFLATDAHSVDDISRIGQDLWLYPVKKIFERNNIKNIELLT